MNIYSYIRVSGKGQLDGDGYDRQAEKINAFCEQHGLNKLGVYYEAAVSGTTEALARPAFAKMIEDIDKARQVCPGPTIQAIVVERMDRLARDLMVSEFLLKECRSRGIKVFAADQGQLVDLASNDGDPTRILIRQVIGAVAQWEKTMLVMKLRAARDRKRATGEKVEGPKPYGSLPGESNILDLTVHLINSGWGPTRIAAHLNQGGFKTRGGKDWDRKTVFHVCKIAQNRYHERQLEDNGEGRQPEPAARQEPESLDEIIASLKFLAGLPRL